MNLRLRDHITETVGRNHEERFIGPAVNCLGIRFGDVWLLAFDFGERGIDVVYFKEAAFLSWVSAVFGEPNLNVITRQDDVFVWLVAH